MELRHLRYFIAVAGTENVTRAAQKLHVSQPALSQQIRDLEDELGFALLERSAKSVRLTEAGRAFVIEAQAVLDRAEQAVKIAREVATAGGELHVGYAPTLTARILPQTLRAFQAASPRIRVRLHDLSTEEMLAGVREGKLDIAFEARLSSAMLRGLQFEELMRDDFCVAVAPTHAWARRRSVSVQEVARQPLITYTRKDYPEAREQLSKLFASVKARPRIAEEHDSVSSLIAGVEAGNRIALTIKSLACMAGPRVKLIPLSPKIEPIVIGAVWKKKGLSGAAEDFLKCAKEVAQKI